MSNFEFHVTKNKLNRESDIKSIRLENDYYDIIAFYYGDYETDYKNNNIQSINISVRCNPKNNNLHLAYQNHEVFIEMQHVFIITIEQAIELQNQIEISQKSAKELTKILNHYFIPNNKGL